MNKKEALKSIATILYELNELDDFVMYHGNNLLLVAKSQAERHVFQMRYILKKTK